MERDFWKEMIISDYWAVLVLFTGGQRCRTHEGPDMQQEDWTVGGHFGPLSETHCPVGCSSFLKNPASWDLTLGSAHGNSPSHTFSAIGFIPLQESRGQHRQHANIWVIGIMTLFFFFFFLPILVFLHIQCNFNNIKNFSSSSIGKFIRSTPIHHFCE